MKVEGIENDIRNGLRLRYMISQDEILGTCVSDRKMCGAKMKVGRLEYWSWIWSIILLWGERGSRMWERGMGR